MRIISGRNKGFRFPEKKMPHARPTTDRAKESLFSILDGRYYFEDLTVLDLYSGIGSIAFEFWSRGCNAVTAVDSNFKSIAYIKDINAKIGADVKAIQSNGLGFLKRSTKPFDIIFADPPYIAGQEITDLLDFCSENEVLTEKGVLILEHATAFQITHKALTEQRSYGQSTFSFFTFEQEA